MADITPSPEKYALALYQARNPSCSMSLLVLGSSGSRLGASQLVPILKSSALAKLSEHSPCQSKQECRYTRGNDPCDWPTS